MVLFYLMCDDAMTVMLFRWHHD